MDPFDSLITHIPAQHASPQTHADLLLDIARANRRERMDGDRPFETELLSSRDAAANVPMLTVGRISKNALERAIGDALVALRLPPTDRGDWLLTRPLMLVGVLLTHTSSHPLRRLGAFTGLGVLQLLMHVLSDRAHRNYPGADITWIDVRTSMRTWLQTVSLNEDVLVLALNVADGTAADRDLIDAIGRSLVSPGSLAMPTRTPVDAAPIAAESIPTASPPSTGGPSVVEQARIEWEAERDAPGPAPRSRGLVNSALLKEASIQGSEVETADEIYVFDRNVGDRPPSILAARHGGQLRAVRVRYGVACFFKLVGLKQESAEGSISTAEILAETSAAAPHKIVAEAREALRHLGLDDVLERHRPTETYSLRDIWKVVTR